MNYYEFVAGRRLAVHRAGWRLLVAVKRTLFVRMIISSNYQSQSTWSISVSSLQHFVCCLVCQYQSSDWLWTEMA